MFEQIGAALAGAPNGRARTPVRRQSRALGRCEAVFWRRTNREEVQRILLAAKRYERIERQAGARSGPLGAVAIEVLELFDGGCRTTKIGIAVEHCVPAQLVGHNVHQELE